VRRREVQVEVQKAGKAEASKRKELLEKERIEAERKSQGEEQMGIREEKKKKVREKWQENVKRVKEAKKREDNIQCEKSLAKALALEGDRREAVVAKKVVRKELTSEEVDQEFRKLNTGQIKANARLAVEQIGGVRKEAEKNVGLGLKMMRVEEGAVDENRLPPGFVMLKGKRAGGAKNLETKNVKASVPDKRGKKTLSIPAPVVEEMDMESGEEEDDFEKEQRNEVRVKIP